MRQRGHILFAAAALVVALVTFGLTCQNYYRVSIWMASYDKQRLEADQIRVESDRRLAASLDKIAERLSNK